MSDNDPVVIVGLAIEAPGGVETADDYWTLLSEQREGLGPFPTDRGWALRELFDGSRRNGFKPIHNLGGFLSSATTFDPEFFRISPREATAMDPQQRVGLRVAWRTLENSGINPDDLAGHDVGCYVGASALEYGPALTEFSHHSGHLITGTSLGVISGRIAYTLDLAGPALTVDTSCSSALAAFHTAVQAIRAGDCDLALAGGVCVMGTPGYFVEFSKQHALSDDGHCRPYSAHASGTAWAVNGEPVTAEVEPRMLLVHFLRDQLRLTGTHWGCDTSNCGTCVVEVDGVPVKSCTMLAVMASGHSIRTVEGLAGPDGQLDPVQEGFMRCHGLQCGFCTPGMLITARALLDRNPDPDEQTIREAISGQICRCTGYTTIVRSIQWAAAHQTVKAQS